MNRFKNFGLWVAIFAFIPIVSESLKVYGLSFTLPGNYDTFVKALLGILILAGILNNPSNGIGYKDM